MPYLTNRYGRVVNTNLKHARELMAKKPEVIDYDGKIARRGFRWATPEEIEHHKALSAEAKRKQEQEIAEQKVRGLRVVHDDQYEALQALKAEIAELRAAKQADDQPKPKRTRKPKAAEPEATEPEADANAADAQ